MFYPFMRPPRPSGGPAFFAKKVIRGPRKGGPQPLWGKEEQGSGRSFRRRRKGRLADFATTQRRPREGTLSMGSPPWPLPPQQPKRGHLRVPPLWKHPRACFLMGLFAPTGHFVARWEGPETWRSVGDMINSKVRRSRAGAPRALRPTDEGLFRLELTCSLCQVWPNQSGGHHR